MIREPRGSRVTSEGASQSVPGAEHSDPSTRSAPAPPGPCQFAVRRRAPAKEQQQRKRGRADHRQSQHRRQFREDRELHRRHRLGFASARPAPPQPRCPPSRRAEAAGVIVAVKLALLPCSSDALRVSDEKIIELEAGHRLNRGAPAPLPPSVTRGRTAQSRESGPRR